ncbi:phage tail protein [Micromonospora echinofusca]|uniref:Phage tail protein n=1 Tax=Micromonospora echinofusca TaxID=47858 RepID=A0ABS3VW35_MICEH|nr:phage tail protein [Micromonospora echinofusca]
MMRGAVPGLASPHPIGQALPAAYLEDDFAQRFTAGLDEVLAPVLLTLDCLDAYLDLDLAPPDFLDWLAGWVAAPVDQGGPPDGVGRVDQRGSARQRRDLVRYAVELHRWRGTARGIALAVELATGTQVEVTDSGGVSCSTTPTEASVSEERAEVRVRIASSADETVVRRILAATVPVHVRVTVERQP